MTRQELGITEKGAAFIEATIDAERYPHAPYQLIAKVARAHFRIEGGVGDREDHQLAAEYPEE